MKSKTNDISILIVEDEIILAMAIEQSLTKMGYKVSGIEKEFNKVMLHIENNFPDLILMDINLNSNISGIIIANAIWKKFKIPIIFLTSYSDDKTINKTFESEPYGYLIKPCRDEDLKVTINMAIHKHKYFFKNKDIFEKKESKFLEIENNLKYDRVHSELYINNQKINLTKNEKKLFNIISQNPGEIVNFETIYSYIWREDVYDMGKLRTLIYRLRQKIKTNPFENMYDYGYKIKVCK